MSRSCRSAVRSVRVALQELLEAQRRAAAREADATARVERRLRRLLAQKYPGYQFEVAGGCSTGFTVESFHRRGWRYRAEQPAEGTFTGAWLEEPLETNPLRGWRTPKRSRQDVLPFTPQQLQEQLLVFGTELGVLICLCTENLDEWVRDSSWKLWLDDDGHNPDCDPRLRHSPPGWVTAVSVAEAEALVLQRGLPAEMDLDHDLGLDPRTGEVSDVKEFLYWLTREYLPEPLPAPPRWRVHSKNPVGAAWVEAFMTSWSMASRRP